jgi:hypothetical protein
MQGVKGDEVFDGVSGGTYKIESSHAAVLGIIGIKPRCSGYDKPTSIGIVYFKVVLDRLGRQRTSSAERMVLSACKTKIYREQSTASFRARNAKSAS